MFSSSVAGAGTLCLGCQLRAVPRRAPVLARAARAGAAAAAHARARRQQRRHASSGSSEAGGSTDDFFEQVLNEQRHGDEHDKATPWPRRKGRRPTPRPKKREKDPWLDQGPFVRTFNDRSVREGAYTQPEVSWEDVWDQDPDLAREPEDAGTGKRRSGGRSELAPVEENTEEIDYGSMTDEEVPPSDFSWNQLSAADRERFAQLKYRPKKVEPPPPPPPPPPKWPDLDEDKFLRSKTSKPLVQAVLPFDTKPARIERKPEKSSRPADDSLLQSDKSSTAPSSEAGIVGALSNEEPPMSNRAFAAEEDLAPPEAPQEAQEPEEPQEPKPTYYRKGDVKMLETVAQLSVETLGQEAEIIVLREDGPWTWKPLKRDTRPTDPGLRVEDHVDQQEELSLDVILENIEGLRPAHQILPAREFKLVFDALMKGFTSLQLETYVERDRKRLEENDERPFLGTIPEEPTPRPWIVSQTRWTPEVNGAVEDVDQTLKGYILTTMPPKQRLAMQLMRECWGTSVRELLDGYGLLDLEVREKEFKLLALGNQRFLSEISRVHLTHGGGKSLQIVKSRKAIRIVAPKVAAESCLTAMDNLFQKIKTKKVKLAKNTHIARFLTADVLEELGRLTNTIVELDEVRHDISVTWISIDDRRKPELEDLSDVVLRLILTSRPATGLSKALAVYPEDLASEQGRLIEDVGNKDKLSWNDRRLAWARLCLPVAGKVQQQQALAAKQSPLDESLLKYKIEPVTDDFITHKSVITAKVDTYATTRFSSLAGVPLGFPRPRQHTEQELFEAVNQPTRPTSSGWLPFRVRTNAIFGHVLHIYHKKPTDSLNEGKATLAAASRRALAPLIPPITELHLPGWVPYRNPRDMDSLIVMRFVPTLDDPTTGTNTTAATKLTLELRLKASDDEILSIDSLHAIAHTHAADICLPGEQVDVRATQRLVAELPGAVLDSTPGMKPLTEFLRDSVLEPAQGRLITPPVLDNVGLPSWLFYAPVTDPQSPYLASHVLAELTGAAAPADGGSKPLLKKKPPKKSALRKAAAKKAAAGTTGAEAATTAAAAAAAPPPHNPYLPAANALAATSYLFAGLEVQRPLETAYDGWRLGYTSIEAGAGGGRRAELVLEARPAADARCRRAARDVGAAAWLRSVWRLATGRAAKVRGAAAAAEAGAGASETVVRWLGNKH